RPPPPPPPPKPPRPPGRSSRGRASFTTNLRPPTSLSCIPSIAACPSCGLDISTNPNPFERPVSRSTMTCADSTVPNGSNIACRSESLTLYGRLPTYNFFATEGLLQRKSCAPLYHLVSMLPHDRNSNATWGTRGRQTGNNRRWSSLSQCSR